MTAGNEKQPAPCPKPPALQVKFYDRVDDDKLQFAVVVARFRGQWVFCRHRERNTLELPGGHREKGESILETAGRELREETGARTFSLRPVCVYSVTGSNSVNPAGDETFGMLYTAEITAMEANLHHEIAQVTLLAAAPENWTYPLIQPRLFAEALARENGLDSI